MYLKQGLLYQLIGPQSFSRRFIIAYKLIDQERRINLNHRTSMQSNPMDVKLYTYLKAPPYLQEFKKSEKRYCIVKLASKIQMKDKLVLLKTKSGGLMVKFVYFHLQSEHLQIEHNKLQGSFYDE